MFTILTVCTANICRSPLMELLLSDRLAADRFVVSSAGARGFDARPIDSMTAMEALRLGQDPFLFRSRPITKDLVEGADLILTATRDHRAIVLDQNPSALRRTFTLLEFAHLAEKLDEATSIQQLIEVAAKNRGLAPDDSDILDPYGRAPDVHRATADMILTAVARIADRLNVLVEEPMTSS